MKLKRSDDRSTRRMPRGAAAGFTLVELILVMFIILLLMIMAAPMLSKFLKTSRVQQTAQTIFTALFHGKGEAQRYRRLVGVFFGDDQSKLNPKPSPGVLPPNGKIEIWTVKTAGGDKIGATEAPLGNLGEWYPYKDPDRNLTPSALTFPDGVRILSGLFSRELVAGKYEHGFGHPPPRFQKSAIGECKRHNIIYARNGGMPGYSDGIWSYFNLLVFDEATGEHVIVWCGEWRGNARPRILPYSLTRIRPSSGVWQSLTNFRDISDNIDK
jgi:type II secretory pathway pseudopilin PulG